MLHHATKKIRPYREGYLILNKMQGISIFSTYIWSERLIRITSCVKPASCSDSLKKWRGVIPNKACGWCSSTAGLQVPREAIGAEGCAFSVQTVLWSGILGPKLQFILQSAYVQSAQQITQCNWIKPNPARLQWCTKTPQKTLSSNVPSSIRSDTYSTCFGEIKTVIALNPLEQDDCVGWVCFFCVCVCVCLFVYRTPRQPWI